MRDLQSRSDIITLVDSFYTKVLSDSKIGYFFTEIAQIDLGKHLPIMYDFWESTLLGNPVYKGNPMLKHIALDKKSPLKQAHFERWLMLWKETVEENFAGEIATKAIALSIQIGGLMQFKVEKQR